MDIMKIDEFLKPKHRGKRLATFKALAQPNNPLVKWTIASWRLNLYTGVLEMRGTPEGTKSLQSVEVCINARSIRSRGGLSRERMLHDDESVLALYLLLQSEGGQKKILRSKSWLL